MSSIPENPSRKNPSQAGGKAQGRENAIRATAKTATETKGETETETGTETRRRPLSPYTIQNLDDAIAHLEKAIGADKAMAIFGVRYWHQRVHELRSTPGILRDQERRLLCLLDRFATTG
ncbi:hypothetical protein [Paraburkholderia oxyphila]|uniref:hypothetical protein n=1 Tax=Paraburkholderia oxyphila TaxID=614212 RepID=UPI0006950E78|nr:hypothetical protein [Paraburkholderia oxyphila]